MRKFCVLLTALACFCIALPSLAREANVIAIIPIGQNESQVIDLKDFCAVGMKPPAAMTGTIFTGQCAVNPNSSTGSTFGDLYKGDGTTQWVVPFTTNRFFDLTQSGLSVCGCRFFKLMIDGAGEATTRNVHFQLAAD